LWLKFWVEKNHFNIIVVFFDFGVFLPVGIFFQNETLFKKKKIPISFIAKFD
jgi:hypothetical protein